MCTWTTLVTIQFKSGCWECHTAVASATLSCCLQFGRNAPRRWEFFFQAEGLESIYSHYNPNVEQLAIHAGPLLERPEERSPYKELPERTVLHLAGATDTRANHGAVFTPEVRSNAHAHVHILPEQRTQP